MDFQNEKELLAEVYDIGEKLYATMCSKEKKGEGHDDAFELLTELGRTLVGADRASFWKWDKENHELWTTSATKMNRIVIPEDAGLVGKALKEKRVIVSNALTATPISIPILTSRPATSHSPCLLCLLRI